MKTKIIVIANKKGGSGKSTLSANLTTCLAAAGFKALAVELDEQATSTRQLVAGDAPEGHLGAYINKTKPFAECVESGRTPNLSVLAPGPDLTTVRASKHGTVDMLYCLEHLKDDVDGKYHFVIIDTACELNHFLGSALTVGTHLLTPVFPEFESISGRAMLLQWAQGLLRRNNPNLEYLGTPVIGLNLRRNADHAAILGQIQSDTEMKAFNTTIPFAESGIQTASNRGMAAVLYRGGNTPSAHAFIALTQEIVERISNE